MPEENTEKSKTSDVINADVASKINPKVTTSSSPKNAYPSDFYDAAGIFRCPKCGEKRRTVNGQLFCPQNDAQCPLKK
jgi:hypothetical protein